MMDSQVIKHWITAAGLEAVVMRIGYPDAVKQTLRVPVNTEWYCGYVAVPEAHKLYGSQLDTSYTDGISVHGGITYAESDLNHVSKPEGLKVWWLGFDCNHYSDNPNTHGAAYVEAECEQLALQLSKVTDVRDEYAHDAEAR